MDEGKPYCREGESDGRVMLGWVLLAGAIFYGVVLAIIFYYA